MDLQRSPNDDEQITGSLVFLYGLVVLLREVFAEEDDVRLVQRVRKRRITL